MLDGLLTVRNSGTLNMDSIKSALENVAADNGRICGGLYYIRSNISNKTEGIKELQDNGGIKILIKCLKKVNPKVLSLTLSILGNCSMNEACREQLFEYGVIKDLAFIIKNVTVDSIDNRTCRMIANLSASQIHIPVLYKHNIPSMIINILSKTKCDATKYSAIRALRKIWENSSKSGCLEMLKCQAVKVVYEQLTSKCKEIVTAVLRALISYLSNATNLKYRITNKLVLSQIIGQDPELFLGASATLSTSVSSNIDNLMNLFPEHPLVDKIIYLMTQYVPEQIQLYRCYMFERIMNFLKKENNHYLILSMCHLLEWPTNRSFFGNKNGVIILLKLIAGTNPIHKELAINTLFRFEFCKEILVDLVKGGLIPLLLKMLNFYIQASALPCKHSITDSQIIETRPSTSSSFTSHASPTNSSGMSPSIPPTIDDNIGSDSCLTPPINYNIITVDSYSPYYSPVCESFDNESINADESESDVSDYENDKSVEMITLENSIKNKKSNLIQLLKMLIFTENGIKIMAARNSWDTILKYIQYNCDKTINENAVYIIQKITKEVLNFETILDNELILITHRRLCRPFHDIESCGYCKRRNNLGINIIQGATSTFESQFAEGIMISKMNDTSETNQNERILISMTIPLVIQSNSKLLIAMLYRYKMFKNICDVIKNNQHPLFDDAIAAIMALFKTTNITYIKSEMIYCKSKECHKNIVKRETTVQVALDDGTLIGANRSFLSSKCPMFEAMFRCGGFKEANQNTIRLNDVSSECFVSFMTILDEYCDCLLPKSIFVLLELIIITDRYLLHEISEKISMILVNSISIDNCSVIYQWSKTRDDQYTKLNLNIIKYLFLSNSRFNDRIDAIKSIIESNYGNEFIKEITSIIRHGLISIIHPDDKFSKYYLSILPDEM